MEQLLAWEGGVVHAGGAKLVVRDYLHDFCGVQLGYSTSVGEGKMIVFKALFGLGELR